MNNNTNFYDTLDLKYPEIGVALQDINTSNPKNIKIAIPVLTPELQTKDIMKKNIKLNTSNLMNSYENMIETDDLELRNYMKLTIPSEVATSKGEDYILKGSKWLIMFIGGDITKPKVTARYEEDKDDDDDDD